MNNEKKNSIVNSSCSLLIAAFIVTATSISVIEIASSQSQVTMAQQQQEQSQVNQTSSVLMEEISFDIDNVTFSHHMATVNGIQLHYVSGGHGDPVVLLHGWPETWYDGVMLCRHWLKIIP
jgi:hypothetical protein